jgi:hypothetical protein
MGRAEQYRKLVPVVIVIVVAASVWGCAPERPESVPADARSIAKQKGSNPINFTAPQAGTIFVYDRSNKKMVYSGRLVQGDTVEIDPKRNNIRMDGRVVLEQQLRDLHEYQVWFDEAPSAAATAGKRIEVKTEEAQ